LIAAGQSIGNYRILSKIGTGGMGAVYLAEHPLIGKKVALKVIHRDLANNKEVVQRFFQEAKAVNKIGSDHIVEIHDFGVTPEGDHFYIMEYLDGKTLAHVLSRDRVLDVMRALHICAQIASALSAAHNAGVIHRDLKPDNVMLTMRLGDQDFVKLLDFGLAKMLAAGPGVIKTAAGVLLGTPQYMSPEACESRPGVDHRTDIYAVGILLFQMVCGQLPFDGESMGEVLVKQVTQLPPPPRALNAQIPPSVEQIILRCLMKQPDARFPTMVALREALLDPEKYLAKSPPIAPARSLAPGASPVDAKTVMAYAADQSRTKIGSGTGPVLPLPAPAPTNPGKASVQTMISDGTLVPPRPPTHGPDMAAPAQPKMNTMRIATPMGYSSRPPKKMWPVVLVFGLLLGLGGGAFAVAWFGRESSGHAGAAIDAKAPVAASGSAGSAVVVKPPQPPPPPPPPPNVGSGSATKGSAATPTPPPPPAVKTAMVEVDSDPSGAEILGPDKKSLGKTPAKLDLPVSDLPLTLELRLAGYKKKTKQIVVSGNTVIQVPLDRVQASNNNGHKQNPTPNNSNNGLMRPEDL
jgi:serine/threonine protein kinase